MNWTTETPTKAGDYRWKLLPEHPNPKLLEVVLLAGDLVIMAWDGNRYPTVAEYGGLWCRLVAAEEVEKAHSEGYTTGIHDGHEYYCWEGDGERCLDCQPCRQNPGWDNQFKLSRAKRVMEGTEPCT